MRLGIENLGIQIAPPETPWGTDGDRLEAANLFGVACEAMDVAFMLKWSELDDVTENLMDVQNILKTHGASEGFMAFINHKDNFTKATGCVVPAITEANKAEVTASCEVAVGETLQKTWKAIVDFVKSMIEKVKEFFKRLADRDYRNMKVLEELLSKGILSKVNDVNAEEFAKSTFSGFNHKIFMDILTHLKTMADLGYKVGSDEYIKSVKYFGGDVDADGNITGVSVSATLTPLDDMVAGEQGWTPATVVEAAKKLVVELQDMGKASKELDKFLVSLLTPIASRSPSETATKEEMAKAKADMATARQAITAVQKIAAKYELMLVGQIEKMAGQMKTKAAPKAEPAKA